MRVGAAGSGKPGVHLGELGIDLGVLCSEPGDEMAEIVARARALTDMRADERRAADLLKELLGGECEPRDADGAPGMHDFDLRLDDGRTLAAEATTDTSRVDRAFRFLWFNFTQEHKRVEPKRCPC